MSQANKKTESGAALMELLAIRLSEQTTLTKSLVIRASVESGKWKTHSPAPRCALPGSALRSYHSPLASYHSLPPALFSLLLATIFFYTPPSFAERADRDKPLHLSADQLLIDDARQISTFTGNVQLTQGTMLIRGDKIVVVQDKEGFKHGTAYGNTASFRQKREGLDEYVEGYGERIEYDTKAETVDFYVRARVKRDLDEVRGEHITYSAKSEIFQVNGNGAGTGNAPPKRVHAILQPKPKEGATQQPAPNALPIKPSGALSPAE